MIYSLIRHNGLIKHHHIFADLNID